VRELQRLGLEQRLARVRRADLLVVRGNPIENIQLFQDRDNLVAYLHAHLTLAKEAKEKGETFMIVYPTGDGEATEFANLLFHLFFQAGWS